MRAVWLSKRTLSHRIPTLLSSAHGWYQITGTAATRVPEASREDSYPQAILKFQPCNNFDYKVHYKTQLSVSLCQNVIDNKKSSWKLHNSNNATVWAGCWILGAMMYDSKCNDRAWETLCKFAMKQFKMVIHACIVSRGLICRRVPTFWLLIKTKWLFVAIW